MASPMPGSIRPDRGGRNVLARQRKVVEVPGDGAGEVVRHLKDRRQVVADALRPLMDDGPGAAGEVRGRRRRAEPGCGVEPQARDVEAIGHRQIAVPVVEVAGLVGAGAEQRFESVGRQRHPDGARFLRGDVAIGRTGRAADDRAVARQDRSGVVVVAGRGAIGRPQGAVVLELLQRRLPGRPIAGEQRRGIVGARQDEGDVDVLEGRPSRNGIGRLDRCRCGRAVTRQVEERRIGYRRHGTLLASHARDARRSPFPRRQSLPALPMTTSRHSTFMPFMKVDGTTLFTDCARLASQ